MMDAKESSNSIFSFLQGQVPAPHKLTVRNTDVLTEHGPVVHAIDGNGHPTLLVPVASQPENSIDWQNKLVTFGYRTITVAGKQQAFLALQCLAERVRSQFSLLADDIMDAVAADPGKADRLTRQTVDRWKELLRDDKPRLLGQSQLSGLYGELLFLEQLAFHHGPWALRSWTGPQGNRHDFEFENASFEVKTTMSNNNMIVGFHGARQLEATDGLPLYVAAYQIERTPQGDSIPTVLERLYDSGIDRLDMLRLLEKVGYFESDSGHYAAHRFLALSSKTLAVGSDFPRITRETMPMPGMLDGISALQYSVDLGPLAAVDIPLEELKEAMSL
ncbi:MULTISPECIES: PD-(D/E)XK motif protein [unclassified Arthrobacter]|uniref:PD-(D/E)XK motif protein n=1 Tax=unclassified Arthrobacter TaxID=235627 RepID=UPI002E083889|nr:MULTISPECIES: PD-(D/E)XK motif protein [unclassified Arthrobacter]MEC5191729.1 hypothetical protein [Arthrobacter sp. MP_M4]MEC5203419.1 hypothetical protein [Arthrobacter sp. MP_M7]